MPGVAETLDWAAALLASVRASCRRRSSTRPSASSSSTRRTSGRSAGSGRARVPRRGGRRPGVTDDRRPSPVIVSPRRGGSTGAGCWPSRSGSGARSAPPGCRSTSAAAIDFARALGLVDIGSKGIVHGAGAALFVRRRDDSEAYDRVFARFWRRRGRKLPPNRWHGLAARRERDEEGEPGASTSPARATRRRCRAASMGIPDRQRRGGRRRDRGRHGLARRLLHGRDPAAPGLRPDDRGRAARGGAVRRPARPRLERAGRGGSSSIRTAGCSRSGRCSARTWPRVELTKWVWRRRVARAAPARRPVRHLGVDGAPLAAAAAVRAGAGGGERGPHRVVRVRDAADAGDPDHAGPRSGPGAGPRRRRRTDWAGGTRIGESFREFNQRWARRTLRTSAGS